MLLYSYSNVVQAREKGNRKVKFENFELVENLDLVENFAVTNFSTKSVDHCISIYFKPSKKQTFLSITEWNLLYFPFSREQSTKISFYSLVVQC